MATAFYNEMKVSGKRENLDNFKSDMAGDLENGPLSFQNVIPEPQDTSKWKKEDQSGSKRWRLVNWGHLWDAIGAEMKDEGEFLVYSFGTRRSAPYGIYDKLIEKYSELDFEIYCSDDCIFSVDEFASRKGKITKNLYFYWQCITWRDGKYKDILYRQDLLKDTLEVVQENIFYPGEYDDAYHEWYTKDVEFSEDNGIATYESISSEENIKLRSEVNYNSLPDDGRCMCCGRHTSELRTLGEAGDPMEDNSERALFINVYRPDCLLDEDNKQMLDKANRVYKSEGYYDPLDWVIKEYGQGVLPVRAEKSWECRDCAVLTTDEYFENFKKGIQGKTEL